MLSELQESYVSKYESPMACYCHELCLGGFADEFTGDSSEWLYHVDRIGRRLVVEYPDGFVTPARATRARTRPSRCSRTASASTQRPRKHGTSRTKPLAR